MEGRIESVWRYPVKGMKGERVQEIFVGKYGLEGDRNYAYGWEGGSGSFPWLTARKFPEFMLHRPYFVGEGVCEVEMKDGCVLMLDDLDMGEGVRLHRSEKNIVDAYPVSLFSLQSLRSWEEEMGFVLDKRRFRANIYVDWQGGGGFYEDSLVGRCLRVGEDVEMYVEERNVRCKCVSVDPDTAEVTPKVLREVVKKREGCAGIYLSLVKEGVVREGARVEVID